jgi:polysaccharide biosynthesis protein PslH
VLFVSGHLPFPPVSGGRRREYELLTRLSGDCDICLCSVSKVYAEDKEHIKELRRSCRDVFLFEATEKAEESSGKREILPPMQVIRHSSKEASRWIEYLLKRRHFDLIHVEGYHLLQHVPKDASTPLLLVEQNVEFALHEQRAMTANNEAERARWQDEGERTRAWERQAWNRADLCATVTEEDRGKIQSIEPRLEVRVVPDGSDHPTVLDSNVAAGVQCQEQEISEPTLLYIANFAYQPNVDAAYYFIRQIFPSILSSVETTRLLLVGNAPPKELVRLGRQPHVCVTGRVRSLQPFYSAADVVICPLRVGGGIKVKMLEALRAGKAIVSTSVGVQGLPLEVAKAVSVSRNGEGFAERVVALLRDPGERVRWETAALTAADSLPTWELAARELLACYREIAGSENWAASAAS